MNNFVEEFALLIKSKNHIRSSILCFHDNVKNLRDALKNHVYEHKELGDDSGWCSKEVEQCHNNITAIRKELESATGIKIKG